jgi:hypothetical protein
MVERMRGGEREREREKERGESGLKGYVLLTLESPALSKAPSTYTKYNEYVVN